MAAPLTLLVVEDDPIAQKLTRDLLTLEGYRVEIAGSAAAFRKAFPAGDFQAVVMDLGLPDGTGLQLLEELRTAGASLPVLMLTASDAVADVVAAMKLGAFDYLTKPLDREKLKIAVRRAVEAGQRDREIVRLRSQLGERYAGANFVGRSPPMRRLLGLIDKVQRSDQTVLITGESGTGKEIVARAVHFGSARRDGPFIDVNCAGLPETLLESELFGHERGAFTGAAKMRRGKFELAHGGTLFLDEIGDMPAGMQAKILRTLEEGAFFRVGGEEKVQVDARVLCATNRDLARDVESGRFRKDLFYRIEGLTLPLPPLRERRDDIVDLAEHFLALANEQEGRRLAGFDPDVLERFKKYDWPGNVRELENCVGRAVVIAEGERVTLDDLPTHLRSDAPPPQPATDSAKLLDAVEALERRMILEALERTGWVKARAARELGVTDRIFAYKMTTLGITRPH